MACTHGVCRSGSTEVHCYGPAEARHGILRWHRVRRAGRSRRRGPASCDRRRRLRQLRRQGGFACRLLFLGLRCCWCRGESVRLMQQLRIAFVNLRQHKAVEVAVKVRFPDHDLQHAAAHSACSCCRGDCFVQRIARLCARRLFGACLNQPESQCAHPAGFHCAHSTHARGNAPSAVARQPREAWTCSSQPADATKSDKPCCLQHLHIRHWMQ
jgi:hypothetical protein